MFRLFSTFYPEKNPARKAEYLECLKRNLTNPVIDEVCLLVEGNVPELPNSPKLRIKAIEKRPLYDDFFTWIREIGADEDIAAIANTDIYLDPNLAAAFPLLQPKRCLALARWEPSGLNDRNDSQDCWVFMGPISVVRGDFPIGVVRCDNRILYELQVAGYEVLNPSFSVKIHHLHEGERVEYGNTESHFVQPPYRYLWPHNLYGPLRTLDYNIKHPALRIGWRIDPRQLTRSIPGRLYRKLESRIRSTNRRSVAEK